MPTAGPTVQVQPAARDHAFHPLRIKRVVRETAEASTFVLDVPADLKAAFAYRAGQFCTFRVRIDGRPHLRSYSMSSAPSVDPELQVTVKRVPGGVVSNWMLDTLGPGDVIETTCPAGVFCLGPEETEVVAFAAGSGITPVFSVAKEALATTSRRVRLLYANRDRDSIIFATELDRLVERYPRRLLVTHRLDVEEGFVDAGAVRPFAGAQTGTDCFLCGPAQFMDIVEGTLQELRVSEGRIHVERFTPAEPVAHPQLATAAAAKSMVTIELGGRTDTVEHHPGTTILQTARQMGMGPPSSCESGSCATCMARVVEGAVEMYVNNALSEDEVADGWVLTCQSVPTTPSVRVVYEEG